MALQRVQRARGVQLLMILAMCLVIFSGRGVAHADSVPLGSQIVCAVFNGLDGMGQPIPPLNTDGCAATSTDSGGGSGGSGNGGSGNSGSTGSSGQSPPTTGGLVVRKVFASGALSPSLFSFSVNGGSPIAFNASGENDLTVATGTYDVIESATSTYTPSYSGCSGIVIVGGATSTCTITNTATNTATT